MQRRKLTDEKLSIDLGIVFKLRCFNC